MICRSSSISLLCYFRAHTRIFTLLPGPKQEAERRRALGFVRFNISDLEDFCGNLLRGSFFALTSLCEMLHFPNPLLLSCQTGSLFFDN